MCTSLQKTNSAVIDDRRTSSTDHFPQLLGCAQRGLGESSGWVQGMTQLEMEPPIYNPYIIHI